MITQEELKELMDYDEDTGDLIWKTRAGGSATVGSIAGSLHDKYLRVQVKGKLYYCHRLVWLHVHGYTTENIIDHINRVRDDNRISNLREVSSYCNMRNTGLSSSNTSGVKGVSYHKRGQKWISYIQVNNSNRHLGLYIDFIDAVCARYAAEQCLSWNTCDSNSPAYSYLKEKGLLYD